MLIVCNRENAFHYVRVRPHYGRAAECPDPTNHLSARCCPVHPVACSRKQRRSTLFAASPDVLRRNSICHGYWLMRAVCVGARVCTCVLCVCVCVCSSPIESRERQKVQNITTSDLDTSEISRFGGFTSEMTKIVPLIFL